VEAAARFVHMPRFYFHLRGGDAEIPDLVGQECDDLTSARTRALRSARDILSHEVLSGRLPLNERIDVEDEEQRPVFMLPFREAVREV